VKLHKDGLARNWEKLGNEFKKIKASMGGHTKRLWTEFYSSHAGPNWFVESCRVSPYWSGHMWYAATLLLIISIGINIWRW